MTTMEMLNELITNGGMFTLSDDNKRYITMSKHRDVVSVNKKTMQTLRSYAYMGRY